MSTHQISVSWWYRHETDSDQSLRTHCQMQSSAASADDVLAEAARMRAQGYTVQQITMADWCTACDGHGRKAHYPRGTRKDRRAAVPAWRLRYTDCRSCAGHGVLAETECTMQPPI